MGFLAIDVDQEAKDVDWDGTKLDQEAKDRLGCWNGPVA
jgi:hypothetical protein